MNLDSRKQSQFELFPQSSKNHQEPNNTVAILKDLTLSQENIIVSCIVLLMICIVFYSFGVERGKRVAGTDSGVVESVENVHEEIIVISEQPEVPMPSSQPVNLIVEERIIDVHQEILEEPVPTRDVLKDFYTIQVASFKLEKNALKEADDLKKGDFESFVVPKGSYTIVCVGKFLQQERAKAFSRKLKKKYGDCLVRRL